VSILLLNLLVSVGRHVADASLWIAIASFLSTFSVHKVLDDHGKEIPIVPKFSVGIITFAASSPSPE
jgi:hypothetical protein